MQIVVLGSGCALASKSRGPAGYLVRSMDSVLLMDCGSGTLQRMARSGVSPVDLAGIFLSHAHLDHMGDLTSILFMLHLPEQARTEDLPLHVGPGMTAMLEGLRAVFGSWLTPSSGEVTVFEHQEGRFEVGELLCEVRPVQHHASSLGIRVRAADGCTVAYLGDTDLCDEAVELCRGVDLAIVECSLTDDDDRAGHLNPKRIAELARRAQPEGLLISHLYPETAELDIAGILASHGCDIPVAVAYDGMGVAIDPPQS